jgi:hypothetical protein
MALRVSPTAANENVNLIEERRDVLIWPDRIRQTSHATKSGMTIYTD